MDAPEDAQRNVPRQLPDELVDEGFVGELRANAPVERRPGPLTMRPLLAEGVPELGSQAAFEPSRADFAWAAIFENAAGSVTARSASTFRSSSMFAFRSPFISWL